MSNYAQNLQRQSRSLVCGVHRDGRLLAITEVGDEGESGRLGGGFLGLLRLDAAMRYCTLGSHSEGWCSASGKSTLRCRAGREIPSFCIFAINVVRLRPSLAAAPFAPPITQPTDSSVRRIRLRSESLRVVRGGLGVTP